MESCRYLTLTTLTVLALALSLAQGEIINSKRCQGTSNKDATCTVHEVRIDPCGAGPGVDCKLALGTSANIEFDFTPTFSAAKVGSQAFKIGTFVDMPFVLMDSDGCKRTKCPLEAGQKQTYKYSLDIGTNSSDFPTTKHEVKWMLWNEETHEEKCCFKFNLQLYKA